mmetsp:Transcript_34386/g.53646  ORF Transcript_34386/g.53646 Transcript_34386/m.53646 type:complete len:100 (-) Transcript_34386:971-1270(-)
MLIRTGSSLRISHRVTTDVIQGFSQTDVNKEFKHSFTYLHIDRLDPIVGLSLDQTLLQSVSSVASSPHGNSSLTSVDEDQTPPFVIHSSMDNFLSPLVS